MAKRKREAPEMQRQGRSQVEGENYESYIKVQDVPSLGRATRTTHPKAPWLGNFLSDIETSYRVSLEWSNYVETVYDQYALDFEETQAIAQEIGVEHPKNPKTQQLVVMTSDLVIKAKDGRTIVWSVKPHDKISVRDVEKLEIERIFWTRKGATWWLVTDEDIPAVLVDNIIGIRKTIYIEDYGISREQSEKVRRVAENHLSKGLPMRDLAALVDELLGYAEGTSLTVFRYLFATKQWIIDMLQPIDPIEPMRIIKFAYTNSGNRRLAENE